MRPGYTIGAIYLHREPVVLRKQINGLAAVVERLPLAKTVDEFEALLPRNTHDEDLAMNLLARQECG